MKKRFKSAISLFLVIAILVTSLPVFVYAEEESWEEQINTEFSQSIVENHWEDIQRETEIILRNPEMYEYIDGMDIKGAEVWHDQSSRTYLLEDGTYLTRYFDEPIMYLDIEGDLIDIDNTLVSQGESYVNSENAYTLNLPKNGEGVTIENKGYNLTLKPVFGTLKNGVVKENAIRYNNIADGVDLQYTANGSNVKEDIIINKPVDIKEFSYEIHCGNLDIQVINNVLYAYAEDDVNPIFAVSAPYMTDNSGNVSQAVILSVLEKDGKQLLTITPDIEWINEENRAYPVIIDPVIKLTQSNLEWYLVENGMGTDEYPAGPNVSHSYNPYLYAGFEKGNLTGFEGLVYGETRSFIKINYDFSSIPEGTIISAKLKAYKFAGNPASGTKVYCKMVTSDWTGEKRCWNTQPTEASIIADAADVSLGDKWVEWDISTAVSEWKNGATNYGLALVPEYENQDAVCFSGPGNEHGQQAMYFDITWTVPNAVDEDLPLNTPVINLRPLTETNSSGVQSLNGVFADGVVRPTLTVNYRLNNVDSGVYKSAEYGRVYPDSDVFDGLVMFTLGYKDLHESNWQSKAFTNLENNVLYRVYATATDGSETTPVGSSDSFIVYEFTSQDTLPYIANFYGVELSQIVKDNRPQDYLGFEGNTYFIRNPQKNAEIAYSAPDNMTDEQKRAIIYANLGRGMHSEFCLEPVNTNIGNYYFGSIDAESSEYNGTFSFERSYNSLGDKSYGVFGKGWSFEYAQKLSGASNGSMVYTMGDGKKITFEKEGNGYKSPDGYYLTLNKHTGTNLTDTYYTITKADGSVYRFNCYGLLVSIKDINGFTTSVQYDGNYNISGITTASGRQYVISTNDNGQIVSVLMPNGGTLRYEYKDGCLVRFINADDEAVTYEYDTNGQMTAWYDGRGICVVKNVYDSEGRIISQTCALGNVSTLSYSDGQTIVTNADGVNAIYNYDGLYRTTKVEGAASDKAVVYDDNNQVKELTERGTTVSYEYDENGNITKQYREDGTYREVTYDEYGKALSVREYDGSITVNQYDEKGNLTECTKPDQSKISYTYDEYGQVTSITDGNGNKTTFVYDGLTKMTMTDGNGNVSVCVYDAMGQLISETDALGNETKTIYSKNGKQLGVWKTGDIYEQYLYDGNGNCIEVVDAEGYKCVFTYDAANRMITAQNPLGAVIEYSYDANGNVVQEKDTLGNVTEYIYDHNQRLIEVIDEAGRSTIYEYTESGLVKSVQTPDGLKTEYVYDEISGLPVEITDNFGTVTYAYDEMGREIEIKYPDGGIETTEYDLMGNVSSKTAVNGLVTYYEYDANGNLLKKTDSMGGCISYQYDGVNNLLCMTNALGFQFTYEYDEASRLVSYTDWDGSTVSYEYDNVGNLLKTTDANGYEVVYTYDKNGNRTSMTDANGNTTTYAYDGVGNLLATVDAQGNATTYEYDPAQRLLSVTNRVSQTITYEYDSLDRVVKTTDEEGYESYVVYNEYGSIAEIIANNGSKTVYTYDEYNQLIKVETADGLVMEYEYDEFGRLIKEWDNVGNSVLTTYDVSGNVVSNTDVEGREETYTYDLYGNIIEHTDYNGDTTCYEYNLLSQRVSETSVDGIKTEYTYNGSGKTLTVTINGDLNYTYEYDKNYQLIKVTDALQNITEYSYDGNGNLLKVTDAKGGITNYDYSVVNLAISETNQLGNTTSYEYDAEGNMIKKTTATGSITEYAYDGRGNVVQEKNPLGHVTEYEYDSMGNLVKETSPRGAVTEYEYNNAGLVLSETDALGNVTFWEYDFDGKLTGEVMANSLEYTYGYDSLGRIIQVSDSTGYSVKFTYNDKGKVASEENYKGAVTYYDYDESGRLCAVTDASGGKTSYTYDELGNLTSITSPSGAETGYYYDELNRVETVTRSLTADTTYTYDELGNVVTVAQGDKLVVTDYDAVGNTVSVTNTLGNVYEYTYDADSRLVETVDFSGNKSSLEYDLNGNIISAQNALGFTWKFSYDGDGNVTEATDALGYITEYRYDLVGNLIAVKSPLGYTTEYTYDSMGNVTGRIDATGNKTSYEYDLHNNLISVTSPDGTVEEFIYSVDSQLEKSVKPDRSIIQYDYDELGRLLEKSYSDGSESVTYGYDQSGNRISMDDESGETTYEYDVLGRVTAVTDGSGHKVEYAYDEYGRVNKITYPEGRNVVYTYDLADQLIKVIDSAGETTDYTYDNNGNVISCVRSSGLITEYVYDVLGQVISVVNTQNGKEISSFSYTYDGNGQIVTEKINQDGNVSDKSFTYDSMNQLTGYTEIYNGETSETTYTYSLTGNRIAVTKGGNKDATIYEYDTVGRLIKETSSEKGTITYEYDSNGNLVSKNSEDKSYTYTYNIENRLTAVHEGGNLLMAASYDGDGNRIFQLSRQITICQVEGSIPQSDFGTIDGGKTDISVGQDADINDIPETDSAENEKINLEDTSGEESEVVKTWYEKVYADPEDSIFWYGFGQCSVQLFGGANGALSVDSSNELCENWNYITDQYELILHSEVQYSEKDVKAMSNAGISEEEIQRITGESSDSSVIIPSVSGEVTRVDYELTYYVNNINTANAQVLMTYGSNDSIESIYTYGNERLTEDVISSGVENEYVYDGRGSVVQTMSNANIQSSFKYDPFGKIIEGVDDNFIGFAYNGEESNEVTGLQYLRARYYDTDLGSFITVDSYLGSLTDVISQNRYTYANNNPVNNIDPTGHYSANVNGVSKYVQSTGLNDLRDYMVGAALWAEEVNARNEIYKETCLAGQSAQAEYNSLNFDIENMADSYVESVIMKAVSAADNYGCNSSIISEEALATFEAKIALIKMSAVEQIELVKERKTVDVSLKISKILNDLTTPLLPAPWTSFPIRKPNRIYTPFWLLGYWGEIHDRVVHKYSIRFGLEREKTFISHRYDLYLAVSNEIWEVKPESYQRGRLKNPLLEEQLKGYIRDGRIEGHPLGNYTFFYFKGKKTIYVEVCNTEPARIFYRYSIEKEKKEKPAPQPQEEYEPELEPNIQPILEPELEPFPVIVPTPTPNLSPEVEIDRTIPILEPEYKYINHPELVPHEEGIPTGVFVLGAIVGVTVVTTGIIGVGYIASSINLSGVGWGLTAVAVGI